MKTAYLSLFLLFVCSCFRTTNAQQKPSPNAAKSVIDFYFNGQGRGVVLADIQVCNDVVDNECTGRVDPAMLRVDTDYKIWMMFIVPQGESIDTLSLQFFREGSLAYSREISVRGALRYRTWRNFLPANPGRWEIRVFDNRGIEIETVGLMEVQVHG